MVKQFAFFGFLPLGIRQVFQLFRQGSEGGHFVLDLVEPFKLHPVIGYRAQVGTGKGIFLVQEFVNDGNGILRDGPAHELHDQQGGIFGDRKGLVIQANVPEVILHKGLDVLFVAQIGDHLAEDVQPGNGDQQAENQYDIAISPVFGRINQPASVRKPQQPDDEVGG